MRWRGNSCYYVILKLTSPFTFSPRHSPVVDMESNAQTSYLTLRDQRIGKLPFGDFTLLRSLGLVVPTIKDVATPRDAPDDDPRKYLSPRAVSAIRAVRRLSTPQPLCWHTSPRYSRGESLQDKLFIILG